MLDEKTLEQVSEVVEKSFEKLNLSEMVEKMLETKLEEKGVNTLQKKIFGASEEIANLEGKEKTVRFIKALYRKDRNELEALSKAAMAGGTAADGGYLVNDEFRGEIVRAIEEFGIVRKLARVIPMRGDTLSLPKVTASVTVTWPGELGAGTGAQPTLAQVQLVAKTLVGLTPMSNELLEDANFDVIELLTEIFAEAIAGEEDNQGLAGSGSPFTGILNASGTTVVTMASGQDTFAETTLDDLRDLITQIKSSLLSGSVYVMHRNIWGIIQKLKENSQHVGTFQNPIVTGEAPKGVGVAGYLWGYPVYLSDKMPGTTAVATKFVIFGNLRYLYLGDRKQVAMSISTDATIGAYNLFEMNMSAVRVVERIGLTVGLGSAFALLKTAAS